MPPAPGRFSTKNCWPTISESLAATCRAVKSSPPPGPTATTMRTGFVGYACPSASADHKSKIRDRPRFIFSMTATPPRPLGAQNRARGSPGQRAALPRHCAVDDRVLDALRAHHHALRAAGQVIAPLGPADRAYGLCIENREVRRHPRLQAPAIADAEEVRRVGSHAPHRLLERERAALAHPGAEDEGRIARVAQHVEVRAAVAQAEQHVAVLQDLGHA